MTFSQAVAKLGIFVAFEVFRRTGRLDAVPFSEWLEAGKIALSADKTEALKPLLPNTYQYDREAAREVIKHLRSKITTFEERLAVVRLLTGEFFERRNGVLGMHHENPNPELEEMEKLGEQAETFDQCVVAYDFVNPKITSMLYMSHTQHFQEKFKTLRIVLLERAVHYVKSFKNWHWIAQQEYQGTLRWVRAVEGMEATASSLDEWVEYLKVVMPYQWKDPSFVEKAIIKITDLTATQIPG